MRSFLHRYSGEFERYVLDLIGAYSGSTIVDNHYVKVSSRLKITVRSDRKLGKIYTYVRRKSKLTNQTTFYRRLLKPRFWVACRNGWWYFNVLQPLKNLEGNCGPAKIIRKCIQELTTENYILASDELRSAALFNVFDGPDVIAY